jgi:hypothetical protein
VFCGSSSHPPSAEDDKREIGKGSKLELGGIYLIAIQISLDYLKKSEK